MAYKPRRRFEWDPAKNAANVTKHGLSFEEATDLFSSGTDYLEIYDADHSPTEDRYIAIGPARGELVVVIYTEPEEDVIRIISARPATPREQLLYRRHTGQTNDR